MSPKRGIESSRLKKFSLQVALNIFGIYSLLNKTIHFFSSVKLMRMDTIQSQSIKVNVFVSFVSQKSL